MKTSVVMATYNGEKYIYEQLNSLRDQSQIIDEVIICDDGSSDNTVSMIKDYILKNKLSDRWSIEVNEKNLGYANNFIKILKKASGEYIFFCDQDDIWHLDKICCMCKIMDQNKQIQLLCSDYEPFTSSDKAPSVPKKVMKKMKLDNSLEKVSLNSKNIYIASLGCDMCIRKSFRDDIIPFWINGWAHDDFVWKTAQCVEGCYLYHKALLKRRLHDSNVSMRKIHNKEKRVQFLKNLADANSGLLEYAKKVKMDARKINYINKTIEASKLRAELIEKRKLINSLKLIMYLNCYQSKKSIFMEPYIALRKK